MMRTTSMLALAVMVSILDGVFSQNCFWVPMYDYFPGDGWCPFSETYKEERYNRRDCHPTLENVVAHLREKSLRDQKSYPLCLRVVRYIDRVPDFGIFKERFMINVNTASGASTTRRRGYFAVYLVQVDIGTIFRGSNSLGYYQNFDSFVPGEVKGPWGASAGPFGGYQRDGDMWWFHSKLVSSRGDGGPPDRLPCVIDELVKAELRSHPYEDEAGNLQPPALPRFIEAGRPAYIGGRRLKEYPGLAPIDGDDETRDAVFAAALKHCGTTVAAIVQGHNTAYARDSVVREEVVIPPRPEDLSRHHVHWEKLFLQKYGWHVTWNFPDGPYFTLWRRLHTALAVGGGGEREMSLSKQVMIEISCSRSVGAARGRRGKYNDVLMLSA